jgi:hypothetical protein
VTQDEKIDLIAMQVSAIFGKIVGANPWAGLPAGTPVPVPAPKPKRFTPAWEQGLYRQDIYTGQRIPITGGAEYSYATKETADYMMVVTGAVTVVMSGEGIVSVWPPERLLEFRNGQRVNAGHIARRLLAHETDAAAIVAIKEFLQLVGAL